MRRIKTKSLIAGLWLLFLSWNVTAAEADVLQEGAAGDSKIELVLLFTGH